MTSNNRTNEPNKYAGFIARQNHQRDPWRGTGKKCLCGVVFDSDVDHAIHQVEAILEAALEAANRVPVQGEPNDDREALKRIAEVASEQRLKDSIAEYKAATSDEMEPTNWELEFWHAGYKHGALAIIEHQLSRATVPDAATETFAEKLEREHGALAHERSIRSEVEEQRDAALAAVERAKALAAEWQNTGAASGPFPDRTVLDVDAEVIAPLLAALDGAPGPEWEHVGMAFEHGGFMRIRNDQLVPEKFDSWRKLMAQYPRVEILKRVKAVPAGPWLPVEGESKP